MRIYVFSLRKINESLKQRGFATDKKNNGVLDMRNLFDSIRRWFVWQTIKRETAPAKIVIAA